MPVSVSSSIVIGVKKDLKDGKDNEIPDIHVFEKKVRALYSINK